MNCVVRKRVSRNGLAPACLALPCLALPWLALAAGCGDGAANTEVTAPPGRSDVQVFSTKTESQSTQESWQLYMAGVKSKENIAAAQNHWSTINPARGAVELTFGNHNLQFRGFADGVFPGVQANRVYEVGVVELDAAEDSGGKQEQRKYELLFISKTPGTPWEFLVGSFTSNVEKGGFHFSPGEFEGSYLKPLFIVAPPKKAGSKGGPAQTTSGATPNVAPK